MPPTPVAAPVDSWRHQMHAASRMVVQACPAIDHHPPFCCAVCSLHCSHFLAVAEGTDRCYLFSRGTSVLMHCSNTNACSCTAKTSLKHDLACQRHTRTAQSSYKTLKTAPKNNTWGRSASLSASARHLLTAHDLCSAAKLSTPDGIKPAPERPAVVVHATPAGPHRIDVAPRE